MEWKIGDICWVKIHDRPVRCRVIRPTLKGWKLQSFKGLNEVFVSEIRMYESRRLSMSERSAMSD